MLHGYLLDGAAQSGDAGRLIVAGNEVIYFLAMFFFLPSRACEHDCL